MEVSSQEVYLLADPNRVASRRVAWMATLQGDNIFGCRTGLLPILGDEPGIDRFAFEPTPMVSLTHRFQL